MTIPNAAAAGAPTSMVAYVSCAEDRQILVFGFDPADGALTLRQTVPVPGADVPSPSNMPLTITPDRRFLYAALRAPPFHASCFAIAPETGRLQWRSSTPVSDPMAYIATDPSGTHLLCASYRGGAFAVYPLAADGGIGSRSTTRIDGQPKAHCIIPGRRADVVYGAVLAHDVVLPLAFDANRGTVRLPPASTLRSSAGAGPRHLALHPTLDVLYVVNEHAGTLDVRGIDPGSGALRQVQSCGLMPNGFSGNARAADLHVTPDGRYLYASVRSTSTVVGCRIEPATGRVTPLGSWQVCGSPRGFGVAPDSRFLIVAGQADNVLVVYRIVAESGGLAQAGSYSTPGNPNWIEIINRPETWQ